MSVLLLISLLTPFPNERPTQATSKHEKAVVHKKLPGNGKLCFVLQRRKGAEKLAGVIAQKIRYDRRGFLGANHHAEAFV